VDSEYALHNPIVLVIYVPKIIKFGLDLMSSGKNKLGHFWHTL